MPLAEATVLAHREARKRFEAEAVRQVCEETGILDADEILPRAKADPLGLGKTFLAIMADAEKRADTVAERIVREQLAR